MKSSFLCQYVSHGDFESYYEFRRKGMNMDVAMMAVTGQISMELAWEVTRIEQDAEKEREKILQRMSPTEEELKPGSDDCVPF